MAHDVTTRDAATKDGHRSLGAEIRKSLGGNIRQYGMLIALLLLVAMFYFLTDGLFLEPRNVTSLLVQNGYILILAIGMVMVIIAGHIDLSVGSVSRLRRRLGRPGDGELEPALADGDPPRPGPRHPRRHVAGLLGGLHRHPGLHRHARRHAPLPRPGPDDPRRPVDPGSRGLPEDRQRLPARDGAEHRVPQPDTGAHAPRDRVPDLLRAEEPRRAQEVRDERAADRGGRHQAGHLRRPAPGHRHAAGLLQGPSGGRPHPLRARHHLHLHHPAHRDRSLHLLGRRKPQRGRPVRREHQEGRLPGHGQHGPARRCRGHGLHRLPQRRQPQGRLSGSSSTPSPPCSSVARPCRAVSVRSPGP